MENNKLHDCAVSYRQNTTYEYNIKIFNSGEIKNISFSFMPSHFMHLAGLEKLSDIIDPSVINSEQVYRKILRKNITYSDVTESEFWNTPLNDPQKNNVTYTLDDRIDTLTNFHDLLNNHYVKAYSWEADCHKSKRPYSSEIKANFMLVFEPQNPKTSDEKIYAFFRFDKDNPNIAHGVSQFPTDRTYNNDGRRSVPEITVMSFIEHNKTTKTNNVIFELPAEEQQRLIANSQKKAEFAIIKKDLRQLRSNRAKFLQSSTERNQRAYEKKLSIYSNRNIYSSDSLKAVIKMLEDEADSSCNEQTNKLIFGEIKHIKSELSARERSQSIGKTSGITIAKAVISENNATVYTPIVTIEASKALTKVKGGIEKGIHLAESIAGNFFDDIKSTIKKFFSSSNNKPPKKKAKQNKTVQSEHKTVTTVSPPKTSKPKTEKEPLFSIAEIKSDKYAPTSSKDKTTQRTKNNDIDL